MRGHETAVVMPYTRLRPDVVQALDGWDVAFVDVSGSDEAYWALLARLWAKGASFVIVEHDILVRPNTLDELVACHEPWCSFQVPYVGRLYAGLSCAKFSAGLIARHPDALNIVGEIEEPPEHPRKHWCRLDSWLQAYALNPGGETMHVHGPPLEHIRDDPSAENPWAIAPTHDCWR